MIANISMLRFEGLESWILRQMPNVKLVKFYCRAFLWAPLLPPNRGKWTLPYEIYELDKGAVAELKEDVDTFCLMEEIQETSRHAWSLQKNKESAGEPAKEAETVD